MYEKLVDHALTNVWCTPHQDLQAVVKPARLTPPQGAFNRVKVLWRVHVLPTPASRYHVYQIGQLNPALMGLFPEARTWTPVAEAMVRENLIVNIYNTKGLQLLRSEVFYLVTADKNLILAVKENLKIKIDLTTEDIFLRVYTNAYFKSYRADLATDIIEIKSKVLTTTSEIIAFQNLYNTTKTLPGNTQALINGEVADTIGLLTVSPGDAVEFVRDASVYQVLEFTLASLSTFDSLLDLKRKYLVHYNDPGVVSINFQDDLDFFLINPLPNGRYKGVFLHRNQADAVRMVTHKDYALSIPNVVALADAQTDWAPAETLRVQMHVRKAGYFRPLVNENNRIAELYKLSDANVLRAMVGVDSTVPNWRAEVLENSMYTRLMATDANGVTASRVEQAYGYNAMSRLLCNTPSFARDFSGQRIVDVPYGLQSRSTGYEYDADGLLLSWHTHVLGSIYAARDIRTRLVEMIAGDAGDRLDEYYGTLTATIDATVNYRMYVCRKVNGIPDNKWQDVTNSGFYHIGEGILTWLIDRNEYYTLVRSDRTILSYELNLPAADGVLQLTLEHRALRDQAISTYLMQIPLGELDVFLNGRSLIEGIDYVVHFPQLVIVNKEYLIDPVNQLQRVTVRFTGFCKADLSRNIPTESGYISYGQLSHNNRFDIRDDKVMRMIVNGALYDRSELKFSESDGSVSPLDATNGQPYLIRDLVTPLRGQTTNDTYALRAASQVIDKRISDYLTLKLPETVPTVASAIVRAYQLYSPFVNKIMSDLRSGFIDIEPLKLFYNDNKVGAVCAPYEYLLAFDPTQADTQPDRRYVDVHPHNQTGVVGLTIYEYKFIARVIALYMPGKVTLSHFIQLQA